MADYHKQDSEIKEEISSFWANHPMTYGYEHGEQAYYDENGQRINVEIGSRAFFEHADKVFYGWNTSEHDETGKFGRIYDYGRYAGKPVLEVGCGMGCMAMNWAQHGAQVTAVDLNPVAVEQTRRRFEAFDLPGDIREADGEDLPFENDTFEFVYSWGVLHHSPRTWKSINELFRVLKPGGRVGVMLYHRKSFLYRFLTEYIEGFLNMERKFLDPIELASRYGDGERKEGNPHTWPVTKREVHRDLFPKFENVHIYTLGTEIYGIFNQWYPQLGARMPKRLMDACIRRWGWSLWITGKKPG